MKKALDKRIAQADLGSSSDEREVRDVCEDVTHEGQGIEVITLSCLRGVDPIKVVSYLNGKLRYSNLADVYSQIQASAEGRRKDSVDICADAASVARMFQHSDADRRLKVRGAPISVVVSRN